MSNNSSIREVIFRNSKKKGEKLFHSSTLCEQFKASCKKFKGKVAHRWRNCIKEHKDEKNVVTYEMGKIQTMTFSEMLEQVTRISCGIHEKFHQFKYPKPDKPRTVGFLLGCCREWMELAHAFWMNNVSILLVQKGIEEMKQVMEKLRTVSCLVIESKDLEFVKTEFPQACPNLENVIVIGKKPIDFQCDKFDIISINELRNYKIKEETKTALENKKPNQSDTAMIMFTSGSTSLLGTIPKGVKMTHKNLISNMEGFAYYVTSNFTSEKYVSYVPFYHISGTITHLGSLYTGIEISFGSPKTMLKKPGGALKKGDLEVFQPTCFLGSPFFYETIKKKIELKISKQSYLVRNLFKHTIKKKIALIKAGKLHKKVVFEDIVFGKIRKMFGNHIHLIVSGGAHLNGDVQLFMMAILGAKMISGFGCTELCGLSFCQVQEKQRSAAPLLNQIGEILPSCKIKLVDVPELGYFTKNNEGELYVQGDIVTYKGYTLESEEKTEENFKDNWFLTGDIAKFHPKTNTFSIIDRKRNIYQLNNNNFKIIIQDLENQYSQSPFVLPNGFLIVPNERVKFFIAIVSIDQDYIFNWAKNHKKIKRKEDFPKFCKSQVLYDAIQKSFLQIAKKKNYPFYQIPKKILITTDIWSIESGELTPSLKIKRNVIKSKFKKEIYDLYDNLKFGEWINQ